MGMLEKYKQCAQYTKRVMIKVGGCPANFLLLISINKHHD